MHGSSMNDQNAPSGNFALRPNVSESEAFSEFRSMRLSSLMWRLSYGPLQRIALVFLPFALYRLHYEMGRTRRTRYFALDQIEGALDLYEFPEAISPGNLLSIETRNRVVPTLSAGRAESRLREKALRLIFQQGFFRLRQPQLQIECILNPFHIPYWLGFYGIDGNLRCRVLDAVRRSMEGQKASLLFERWLASPLKISSQP